MVGMGVGEGMGVGGMGVGEIVGVGVGASVGFWANADSTNTRLEMPKKTTRSNENVLLIFPMFNSRNRVWIKGYSSRFLD